MPYLSLKQTERLQLKNFSRYHRTKLLNTYRHCFYTRLRPNNVFLNTFIPQSVPIMSKMSAGQLPDYAKRKKKKKTYMAGFETSFLLSQGLVLYKITTVDLFFKGHGAQKRGIFLGLMKNKLFPTTINDVSPIVHNGTRAFRQRRL